MPSPFVSLRLSYTPIRVLEKPTASVDPEDEHLIQEAITNMSKGKTLIVIAHRLSAIRSADLIVVMDGGHVEAAGKHETLIESCPLYAEMSAFCL
jgi:ATP-binding cassette subfamily B protein